VREWVENLAAGARGAQVDELARFLISDFCVRAWANEPQSPHALRWLADALDRMLDHDYKCDAREAFSLLSKRKGQRLRRVRDEVHGRRVLARLPDLSAEQEARIDQALEASFPASDPPRWILGVEAPVR
jgi:hypothetical protein